MIKRFGSATNLNIHLHCLVLDGVYRRGAAGPVFVEVPPPTDEDVRAVLHKIVGPLLKLFGRRGALVEQQGSMLAAHNDGDSDDAHMLRPLPVAACTYQIAFGPRAGHELLSSLGMNRFIGEP